MAIYGLTAVHLDAQGNVVRARMQPINGSTNQWVGIPGEFEAADIANNIATGDVVNAIFIVTGGGTVSGPNFRRVVFSNGTEGIELEQDLPGRRVQDLIQF